MLRVKPLPTATELETLRRGLHLTQDELAHEIGISRSSVQSLEAGGRPGIRVAKALRRWLDELEEAA